MGLSLSLVACGGTEAELCAEQPDACIDETSEQLKAAAPDVNNTDLVAVSGDPWGKRAGAYCAANYPANNPPRTSYCVLCCDDTMVDNPNIHQWNVCIRECNARLGGGPRAIHPAGATSARSAAPGPSNGDGR